MSRNSAFVACAYLICVCVVVGIGLEYSNLSELIIFPISIAMTACMILPACSFKD